MMSPKPNHSNHNHTAGSADPSIHAILAPYATLDEDAMNLVGVTHSLIETREGWVVPLSRDERGRSVVCTIYPVFADADGTVYFIEVARSRRVGEDWRPIDRNADGMFVLDAISPFDEFGLRVEFEAVPQGGTTSGKRPKRKAGDITVRDEGGDDR